MVSNDVGGCCWEDCDGDFWCFLDLRLVRLVVGLGFCGGNGVEDLTAFEACFC